MEPVFSKLKQPLDDALSSADMCASDIDEVLLVGGSSRIPWVKSWLEQYFGKSPSDVLDADTGVAVGATLLAGQLASGFDGNTPILVDVNTER